MIFALLLLQSALDVPVRPGGSGFSRTPGLFEDVMFVLAVVFGLMIVLLIWAKYFRKTSRHHTGPRVSHRVIEGEISGGEGGSRHHHHHHRHRRHRRDHRPRNPTLAETGGLPPPRPQDQAPPSA